MTPTSTALIPMADIDRMAVAISKSGLFGIKTPEQAAALMLVAQAQGRHPASVAMEYDVIQGRPAIKSAAALARFQEYGGSIKYIKRTEAEVSAEFSHPQGGSLTVTWNIDRAKKMGLADKDNWKKQPMVMLTWRVVAEGVRAIAPGCLGGSYLVEEVQDFEPVKTVKPPKDITPKSKLAPEFLPPPIEEEEPPMEEYGEEESERRSIVEEIKATFPTSEEDAADDRVAIAEVSQKETKNSTPKKPIYRYTILTGEGEVFYTFDSKLANTAIEKRDNAELAKIEFKDEGKFGKTLVAIE